VEDGGIDLIPEFVQQAVKHLPVMLGQGRSLLKVEVKTMSIHLWAVRKSLLINHFLFGHYKSCLVLPGSQNVIHGLTPVELHGCLFIKLDSLGGPKDTFPYTEV